MLPCADKTAWLPDYHGSVMMVPVVFVTWVLVVAFTTLVIFAALRAAQQCRCGCGIGTGASPGYKAVLPAGDAQKWVDGTTAGDVEIAAAFAHSSHLH
jgi:hypothetical protein